MNVLLDTNIIIYRESIKCTNENIGMLYNWLSKNNCRKYIHPLSIIEIKKYKEPEQKKNFEIKLKEYEVLQYDSELADEIISDHELINFKNDNDKIDMHLINEVFLGKVDYMITQDRKLIDKAKKLNIQNKVLTIEQFIELQLSLSHDLPSGELFIDKVKIGSLNFKDVFFNSLREAYNYTEKMEFDIWLTKKSNNFAYVYKDSLGKIQGFLYLKEEKSGTEKYDIVPSFNDCNRLKIGTFKVNSTGFRLGERFMKIIFDTALSWDIKEIYVTCFDNESHIKSDPENYGIKGLVGMFKKWGFIRHGEKISNGESVYVKKIVYENSKTVKENFPLLLSQNKWFLPIEPEFHKKLFPNSLLRGEKLSKDEVTNPTSYALENVYISFAGQTENSKLAKVGDIMLIYRKGNTEPKHFSSVVTTAIIITDIFRSFNNIDDFLSKVENRSVFTKKELELFYVKQKDKIVIVKFVLISALSKKVTLEKLRKLNIIEPFAGPRPFAKINDKQFNIILSEAKTEVKFSKVDENE